VIVLKAFRRNNHKHGKDPSGSLLEMAAMFESKRWGVMKKFAVHTRFVPEKYGMMFCPQCNGPGKFISEGMEPEVCKVCGGFGLVKNRSTEFEEDGTYLVILPKPNNH
jgi:hypothetical protein